MGSGCNGDHPSILLSFDNMDVVVNAIRSGNVTQLSPFFDVRVDITLPDKSDTYGKTQLKW
jgi:hypothetical protein